MFTTQSRRTFARRVRRGLQRILYRAGNTVLCPYCGWSAWRFLPAGRKQDPNRLCPGCGSLERYRMLPLLLARELPKDRELEVLELAPKACFTRYARQQPMWRYISSDLSSPLAMVHGDLRAMPFESDRFDVIVCFHVMEHIQEDEPAFREIARMLTPDGLGVLCVPLGGEETQEGAPESEWERLYGQYDHVRYYGFDVEQRMERAGLVVKRVDTLSYFTAHELERYGLRGDDRYLYLVRKATA